MDGQDILFEGRKSTAVYRKSSSVVTIGTYRWRTWKDYIRINARELKYDGLD
jgi:hypothetical protein